MEKKRIFILNGHPARASLSHHLAETYGAAAQGAGHEIRVMHLHDMDFDPDFGFAGYAQTKPLEADLEQALENLRWCEHVVMVAPMWWGGVPAKLKGVFDRAFLPGTAFDPRQMKLGTPKPLLAGRTARVVLTSDTPDWFFRLVYRYGLIHQLRAQVFGYVGIKPVALSHFAAASHPKPERLGRWVKKVAALGAAGK
ncbi:MAG: NAD(P)H-dependent oxidoreductase [Sulfitobacter sp.]